MKLDFGVRTRRFTLTAGTVNSIWDFWPESKVRNSTVPDSNSCSARAIYTHYRLSDCNRSRHVSAQLAQSRMPLRAAAEELRPSLSIDSEARWHVHRRREYQP